MLGSANSISEAYAVYIGFFAPIRGPRSPLADFVDVLRANDRDTAYSDEQWVTFLLPFTQGDEDAARDLWDALLCQPSQLLQVVS